MPPIQVKDCPDEIYAGLKQCASRENRNLSQEMLHILGLYIDAHAKRQQPSSRRQASVDPSEGGTFPDRLALADGAVFAGASELAGAAAFAYVGTNYAERRAEDPAASRVERRKAAFARIAKLPAFTRRGDGVTTADLLRESREEAR